MTFESEGYVKFVTKNNIFWESIWFFDFAKTKKIALLKQEKVFFDIIFYNKYTSSIFNALPICAFLYVLSVFLLENTDPLDGANFDPRDMILAIMIEVNKTMLHAKYLSFPAYAF